jgi:hypothetical protein
LNIGQSKRSERLDVHRNAPIVSRGAIAEENGASFAATDALSAFEIKQMVMAFANLRSTQLTLFRGSSARTHKPAQVLKHVSRLNISAHIESVSRRKTRAESSRRQFRHTWIDGFPLARIDSRRISHCSRGTHRFASGVMLA